MKPYFAPAQAKRRAFLSMLGLLIGVAVIFLLFYLMVKAYFLRKPQAFEGSQYLPQDIRGATQYKTIINDAHSLVSDVNKRLRLEQTQIDDMLNQ